MMPRVTRRSNLFLVPLTLVVALAMAAPARATPLYSITDLGPSSYPGLSTTYDPTGYNPLTINSSGKVGSYLQETVSGGGFSAGGYQVLNPQWANSNGKQYAVVGPSSTVPDGQQVIAPPGSVSSLAQGISSTGVVVGSSDSPTMPNFVYSFASKAFLNLNLANLQPGAPVPSSYYTGDRYLFSGQSDTTPFHYYGVNAQNEVVGTYFVSAQGSNYLDHAFIASLTRGAFGYGGLDLNNLLPPSSGWILTSATGINNAGQIVGYGINPQGTYSGYLLTPNQVPEPSVLAIFGLASLGLAARKLPKRMRSIRMRQQHHGL